MVRRSVPHGYRWRGRLALLTPMFAVTIALFVLWFAPRRQVAADPVVEASNSPQVDLRLKGGLPRLREGSRLTDQRGYFTLAGDRVAFHTVDGRRRLVALENLNLERIAGQIRTAGERSLWSVSGTVTEYQGSNYLLVTRATLKSERLQKP